MKRGAHPDNRERTRLRIFLALLFLALALPSVVLIRQTLRQLKWESFHLYRLQAQELGARIDATLAKAVAAEEARSFADYRFAIVAGDANASNAVQRSPLAAVPPPAALPGVIGYFEVEADGAFTTPALPVDPADAPRFGLSAEEIAKRRQLADRMLDVLNRNRLLERGHANEALAAQLGKDGAKKSVVDEVASADDKKRNAEVSQAAFDQLNALSPVAEQQKGVANARNKLGRVSELKIGQGYQDQAAQAEVDANANAYAQQQLKNIPTRAKRKEQSAVLEDAAAAPVSRRVRMFESEVDPFEFSLLDSGHGVLFRKAWRNGQRIIQGAILDQQGLLRGIAKDAFEGSTLAVMSDMVIAYHGDVLEIDRGAGAYDSYDNASELRGELLHRARLAAPFGDFELLWTINRLPPGPGARVIGWASVVLLAVLLLGFVALYRLGLRQIALARQQQDFVSAVSHELKTPLTSIRMYAEMLRAGWAAPDKQQEYFRFIHDESERLSRLIANVLQLARLERNEPNLELKQTSVETIADLLRSRIQGQADAAGFAWSLDVDASIAGRELVVDADALVQIATNLVDNALKFSAHAERREIAVALRAAGDRAMELSVRDYGPGIDKAQTRKIFELFYRAGSELTRETLGTGIGLALVRQLARAMGGEVDVVNREPGAEFRVRLQLR